MTTLNRHKRRALVARRREPKVRDFIETLRREGARIDDHIYLRGLENESVENGRIRERIEQQLIPMLGKIPEQYESYCLADEQRSRIEALEAMRPDVEDLPRDLLGVVRLAAKLYPDRLTFLEEAHHSAEVSQFRNLHIAWRVLRAMATTLHGLYVGTHNIQNEFRDQTGFELALTESSATREIKYLIRQRMTKYGERLISTEGHVKYGSKSPNLLRVHFAFPDGSPTILIAHVGDHMETAGTRRMRT